MSLFFRQTVHSPLLFRKIVKTEHSALPVAIWVSMSRMQPNLACENISFSSLFAAGNVSRKGTSATQRQKFHTDDANQCLHNKSGSHRVANINLSNFASLLDDFGKVLCSSAKLKCLFQRRLYSTDIDCFVRDSSRLHLTFVAFCLLSVICKLQLRQCNYSVDQSGLLTGFWTCFTSSVWNFCR